MHYTQYKHKQKSCVVLAESGEMVIVARDTEQDKKTRISYSTTLL